MYYVNLCIFILLSSITVNQATKPYLIPGYNVLTQLGASYLLMIKHDTAQPTDCFIHNGNINNTLSIDIFNSGIPPTPMYPSFQNEKLDTDIITSIGNGICGFKMDNVSKNTSLLWYMTFTDESNNKQSANAQVILRPTFPRHTVIYERVGSYLYIQCATSADDEFLYDLLYCKLFNPQNQVVKLGKRNCGHSVSTTKISDFGVWKCLYYFKSNMIPTEVNFEFLPKETDIVQTWTNTSENILNIGCLVLNSTKSVDFCVMIRPDGNQIPMIPGLATPRYTSLNTNLTKHICSMQIKLPLEETEKGVWRCEQHDDYYGPIGGFINVSIENTKYKPVPEIPSKLLVQINTTLTITCQVPYSSPYCYMRSPDGFIYPLNDNRKTSLGICEFKKQNAQISDNGTWFCGFGQKTGEPDDVYSFEVFIREPVSIEPEKQEIETKTAGIAKLLCSTKNFGDYPLKYCRFLSPGGKIYQIGNHETSDRISYEGRGLEYGDCGILLHDVSADDEGTWSCITRIQKINLIGNFDDTEEKYTNIHLSINDSLSVASTLGITLGVGVVVITTVVFFIHRYLKRRRYQTEFSTNRRSSQISQDSSQQEVVFNVATRGYQATDMGARYPPDVNPFGRLSDSSNDNREIDVIDDSINRNHINNTHL